MTATLLNGPFGTWHSALDFWQLLVAAGMFVLPVVAWFVVDMLRAKRRN